MGNNWQDMLPGYIDVDVFQFDVPSAQDWWILYFTVFHGVDTQIPYALDVYCNGSFRFTTSAFPGEDVQYEVPAETGLWQAKVRSIDGRVVTAPTPYGFQVRLSAPVSGVANEQPKGNTELDLNVNRITRMAWGPPLEHPATLRFFDAAGREVWSRDIHAGSSWSEHVDARVPSGVYFLRLSDGTQSTARRLVVVR